MIEPSVSTLKKYLSCMSKMKAKYITAERLSKVVGIYPEVISDTLSYFDATLKMDYEYNLLELVPTIKQFIEDKEKKKDVLIRIDPISKKDVDKYDSVIDFVYKKMAIGGFVDKSVNLSCSDLRILKRLINEELNKRKKK